MKYSIFHLFYNDLRDYIERNKIFHSCNSIYILFMKKKIFFLHPPWSFTKNNIKLLKSIIT